MIVFIIINIGIIMSHSYLAVVAPNKDYLSKDRIIIDSFYEIEYVKYFDKQSEINSIWKLFNKDFEKLEERKGMPKGTIDKDISVLSSLQLRSRFAVGDVILIHAGETEITSEGLDRLINSMECEEIHDFIEKAKI